MSQPVQALNNVLFRASSSFDTVCNITKDLMYKHNRCSQKLVSKSLSKIYSPCVSQLSKIVNEMSEVFLFETYTVHWSVEHWKLLHREEQCME